MIALTLRKNLFFFAACLPLILFLFIFTGLPVLQVFHLSLQNPSGAFTLDHFRSLFVQPEFRSAIFNTLIIAVGSVAIEIFFGMLLALALSGPSRAAKTLRVFFILPLAVPTVVVATMMSYLFASSGWINRILMDTGLITQAVGWMDGGSLSLWMVILADSWKVTPLVMLILLDGINAIDHQLYEAAKVEGATRRQMFFNITLPLLMPSVTTAVIIRGIDAFRIFALVLILMGQNLKVVGTFSYLEYMEYQNVHSAAASAVVLFGLILAAVLIYIRSVGRKGLAAY